MPGYAVLPAVTEWVVEGGHTLVYTRIADVGVLHFLAFFAAYMACVEFLVYWTHRWLHENRASYKCAPPFARLDHLCEGCRGVWHGRIGECLAWPLRVKGGGACGMVCC